MSNRIKHAAILLLAVFPSFAWLSAQDRDWYEEEKFKPQLRIPVILVNDLDIERENCPVVIPRAGFPMPDLHEMMVTVVDPALPPYEGPSPELLNIQGGHMMRSETNGHAIFHQMDDLDKDGIWDELFFQTDLAPLEKKTVYIYVGENIRGWNKHYTHANVGSYCRHQIPFWESEHVGWKIWFANCVDVYAKRKPVLMSQQLYMENLDGYGVSAINPDWGSDIQSVAGSFGGGAICLFEYPEMPDSVSMPRFTPMKYEKAPKSMWNAGPISDTRYAHEVISNGPLRSIIKIKTMNWNTGSGSYELEQYYTAYAHQSYTTCQVRYTRFAPAKPGVNMGCGIRIKPEEKWVITDNDMIISAGPERVTDPEDIDNRAELLIDFIGTAMVVKEKYEPRYQLVKGHSGNHALKIGKPVNEQFEYMILSAWGEGAVLNNYEDFAAYVEMTRQEFNSPVGSRFEDVEFK